MLHKFGLSATAQKKRSRPIENDNSFWWEIHNKQLKQTLQRYLIMS